MCIRDRSSSVRSTAGPCVAWTPAPNRRHARLHFTAILNPPRTGASPALLAATNRAWACCLAALARSCASACAGSSCVRTPAAPRAAATVAPMGASPATKRTFATGLAAGAACADRGRYLEGHAGDPERNRGWLGGNQIRKTNGEPHHNAAVRLVFDARNRRLRGLVLKLLSRPQLAQGRTQ